MIYYAHSARRDRPAKLYADHVQGVVANAEANVQNLLKYSATINSAVYESIVMQAAYYHDLGKLNHDNQKVLSGKKQAKGLPVEHRDAGVSHLLGTSMESTDATLVYAHHGPGLPNLNQEKLSTNPFRWANAMEDTDTFLSVYLDLHKQLTEDVKLTKEDVTVRLSALEHRMLLSCLVDADHSDAAGVRTTTSAAHWQDRIEKLDSYVASLAKNGTTQDTKRNKMRRELYECCKNEPQNSSIEYCDSPVGTGKTTAVVARALEVAKRKKLRRIFVILPYTNIISQTVAVLRNALVLEGEDPFEVVAEHHHQADFQSFEYRHLATTWSAPIIVTTAVQLFETLASNYPAKLRKLHQLPGSCIVIDESHAVLPPELMSAAWRWLTDLATNWGCYVCLCSGTSFRFWENTVFKKPKESEVTRILTNELADSLESFEAKRVTFNVDIEEIPHFRGTTALVEYLERFKGPRLVVLNTVRNAAYLAKVLKDMGKDVLHLSTALTPKDREKIIEKVKYKLKHEQNWTLVATSCVECGMDFSFRNGFCELRSLQSYLQLAGRVNRNGEYIDSHLNCFTVLEDNFNHNPSFEVAQSVFRKLIEQDEISSNSITDLVSRSFEMECKLKGGLLESISKADSKRNFADVAKDFRVIADDTVTVVVDPEIIEKIRSDSITSNRELQRGSVNMSRSTLEKLNLEVESELPHLEEDQYDDFLGYMKGIFANPK